MQVYITKPFLISQTEVTQAQWSSVGLPNPGRPLGCIDCPVNFINLYEAFLYCNVLSEIEGLDKCYNLSCCEGTVGNGCPFDKDMCSGAQLECNYDIHRYARRNDCPGYRLPTGPEWEYAARAGTVAATYGGDIIDANGCISDPTVDEIAWHCGNTDRVMTSGMKEPNGWDIYDMLGNLHEMVDYRYDGLSLEDGEGVEGPLVDPVGSVDGWGFERRGGSYISKTCRAKSASRLGTSLIRISSSGFRVVRTIVD
ncbi:formylglycine-generating enzyme family protein [Myxococcota bacterium]